MHCNSGCLSFLQRVRAGIVAPLTSFWNLVVEMAEAAMEGHRKDLRSPVTAGLASHLTLISPHLGALLPGVKSTSYLSGGSTKSEGRQTPTHHQTLCRQSLNLWLPVCYFCCAVLLLSVLSHPPAQPTECLIIFLGQQYA